MPIDMRERWILGAVWLVDAVAMVWAVVVAIAVNSSPIVCSAVIPRNCLPDGTTFAEATGDYLGYWFIGIAVVLAVGAVVFAIALRSRRRVIASTIVAILAIVAAIAAIIWAQDA